MVDEYKQIGKFKVIGKLGQGSFGTVLKGYDPNIRREVAIKICTVEDEGLRKRFAREAQISGNLQHKNIVTVFAADTDDDGVPYLVQEFLDGEDVRDLIRRREAVPSNQKIDQLLQVARGLAHAHAHGVIHRDVKPANIRLLSDGVVKIMDFGIAKLASAETQLTQKGVTMGTASYLPPEQVRGGDLDHRADIFSFGVLAYELLTYERPFQGNTLSALVYQILYKVPVPMKAIWPECPEVLSDLVAKCLEKKPEARFATMAEIIPRLERISEEIEAGKWPALRGVSTVQAFLNDVPDDTGVMSQTEISRTARAVEEEKPATGSSELATPTPRPPMPPPLPVEGRVTSVAPLPSSAELEMAPTEIIPIQPRVATPATPTPAIPTPATPTPAATAEGSGTVPLSQDQLANRAQQISKLIAEGKLEDAKEHLERTLSEQLEATGGSSLTAAASTIEIPTVPMTRPGSADSGAAQQGLAGRPLMQRGPAPRPGANGEAVREADSGTGTGTAYMTAIFSWPPWQRWAALAAAVVVLALSGWFFFGRGKTEPKNEPPPPPMQTVRPVDTPPTAAATGWVLVAARPWAQVTEITDGDGYVQGLPGERFSPVRLELAPGTYRLQLEYHPDGYDSQAASCEVTVAVAETAECRAEFKVPSVTDYFKDSGWWP